MCYNTTDIKFLYDDLYFDFTDRIKDSDFQGTQILHIHYHTKDTPFINYKIDVDRIIINSNEIDLKTQDTIKIITKDSIFTLRDFRNYSRYGGKKFLECNFGSCIINNKKRICLEIEILCTVILVIFKYILKIYMTKYLKTINYIKNQLRCNLLFL